MLEALCRLAWLPTTLCSGRENLHFVWANRQCVPAERIRQVRAWQHHVFVFLPGVVLLFAPRWFQYVGLERYALVAMGISAVVLLVDIPIYYRSLGKRGRDRSGGG
jgi:hypothetical protein